jgi:hypothetical protein
MNRFNCVILRHKNNKFKIVKAAGVHIYAKLLEMIGFEFGGDMNGSAYGADFLLLIPYGKDVIIKEKLNGLKLITIEKLIGDYLKGRPILLEEQAAQFISMYNARDTQTAILGIKLIFNCFSYQNFENYARHSKCTIIELMTRFYYMLHAIERTTNAN